MVFGDLFLENFVLYSLDLLLIIIVGMLLLCILNNLKNIFKCCRLEMRFIYKKCVYKKYLKFYIVRFFRIDKIFLDI